jgi:hypothetical protein
VVLFAHGSGSSRHSVRNRRVAGNLQAAGYGTLLIDLLTAAEERVDEVTRALRFDVRLLSLRLTAAADWLSGRAATRDMLGSGHRRSSSWAAPTSRCWSSTARRPPGWWRRTTSW